MSWEGKFMPDEDLPLHPDWEEILERRAAEVEAGTAETVPWEEVREASLARLRDDDHPEETRC